MSEHSVIDPEQELIQRMQKIKHPLIVMSGKGGVGKTTVSVNLAYALSLRGYNVGLLDVDLHGPNIAKMLGVEDRFVVGSDAGIEPVAVTDHLKVVSMALTGHAKDQPMIWRGPMKASIIKQFLKDVHWGELDYLVIDAPPGTGDEPLSICQLVTNLQGVVIVTTPQEVAILDARKSILFAKEMKVPVIGVIENMSGFVCPHCRARVDIFKKGGGEVAAQELGVPFLGQIPLDGQLVELGDQGKPFVSCLDKTDLMKDFFHFVDGVVHFMGKKKVDR